VGGPSAPLQQPRLLPLGAAIPHRFHYNDCIEASLAAATGDRSRTTLNQ
jgi:hypothetical protein